MTMQEKQATSYILNVIDFNDDTPISSLWSAVNQAVGFQLFIAIINKLWSCGLIYVDNNNVAHRVRGG